MFSGEKPWELSIDSVTPEKIGVYYCEISAVDEEGVVLATKRTSDCHVKTLTDYPPQHTSKRDSY